MARHESEMHRRLRELEAENAELRNESARRTPNAGPAKIIITLEGGLVSAVVSHDPALIGLQVAIVDYDTDGADDSEVTQIEQADGSDADAIVHVDLIEKAEITFRLLDI